MSQIMVHIGGGPYICEACGIRSIRRGLLMVQSQTHTGERPLECDIGVSKKGFVIRGHHVSHNHMHSP
jgi:hypothetical protein